MLLWQHSLTSLVILNLSHHGCWQEAQRGVILLVDNWPSLTWHQLTVVTIPTLSTTLSMELTTDQSTVQWSYECRVSSWTLILTSCTCIDVSAWTEIDEYWVVMPIHPHFFDCKETWCLNANVWSPEFVDFVLKTAGSSKALMQAKRSAIHYCCLPVKPLLC